MQLPQAMYWLFWEVDVQEIDLEKHADFVLARVLEKGRLEDVRWLMQQYGPQAIHDFFRHVGHSEISDRTRGFWRPVFDAHDEVWQESPAWRKDSAIPWPG